MRLVKRRDRHPHLANRQGHKIERLAVADIHQHLKALPHQHRQFVDLHRLRQQPAVAGDHVQRTLIAGGEVEGPRVTAVKQTQAQPALRRGVLRINGAVGQQRVAKPAYRRAHHVQLVVNLPVSGEFLVLHNHRHIVDAPLLRQAQQAAFVVFNQHQPRQPHRYLMARFAMLMRMEPAGRRALVGRKGDAARAARFDDALRPTVYLARHFQSVPVHRRLFSKRIVDIHRHRFTFAQL